MLEQATQALPAADLSLGSGAPSDAVDYPAIDDRLQAVTSDLEYRYNEALSFAFRYRWEAYDQKDFQFDELGLSSASSFVEGVPVSGSNDVFLANGVSDYNVHILSLSTRLSF